MFPPNRRLRVGSTPNWSLFVCHSARRGGAHRAAAGGGRGKVPEVLLLLLDECDTLGCEREFSLLASVTRGSKRVDGGVEE
jgi:hypothetical protein